MWFELRREYIREHPRMSKMARGVKWSQVQNPVSPTKELAVQRRFWRNPEPPRRHLRTSLRQPELATPTLTARADPPTRPPRPAPCRRMVWPYTSPVIAIEECPSRSATALICTPD